MYGLWWWASPNKAPNSSKKVEEEEGISVVSHVHPKALAHHHLEVEQFYDLFWMMMKPAMRPSGHTFHPSWSWSSLHTEKPHKDSWASFGSLNFRGILFFTTYHEMRRENYWISDRLKKTFSRYILWQEDDIQLGKQREKKITFYFALTASLSGSFSIILEQICGKTSYFQINWFSNWSKSSSQSLHCRLRGSKGFLNVKKSKS